MDCDIDDLVNSRVNVVDYNATEFGIPINSRSIGTITLATPDVPEPMAMRYAWRSWGPAPLFNDDGLPAQPFRLDLTDHTSPVESAEPVTPAGTAACGRRSGRAGLIAPSNRKNGIPIRLLLP